MHTLGLVICPDVEFQFDTQTKFKRDAAQRDYTTNGKGLTGKRWPMQKKATTKPSSQRKQNKKTMKQSDVELEAFDFIAIQKETIKQIRCGIPS